MDSYLADLVTETQNPDSEDIDCCDTLTILTTINNQDKLVALAVEQEIGNITAVVDAVYLKLKKGGRLFYVGAGTSGRIGVLDASECPPTYGSNPSMIQGIIAGGDQALRDAVEGAEDDEEAGRLMISEKCITSKDAVIGITASGSAPYVLGALKAAGEAGAFTAGLCNNRPSRLEQYCEVCISPIVGPEVISGSTRMKSGTSQKLVLNMISTGVMIKLGKVYGNLMVDMMASNKKLYQRSIRMIRQATGVPEETAVIFLEEADYHVKLAIMMIESGLGRKEASDLLNEKEGQLREAIQDACSN